MNSISFIGRLTADPVARESKDGDTFCSMRLAIPKYRNGEQEPIFVDVTAFDRQAELALEHLAKGRQVGIDGRLDFREWDDDDGNRRSVVYVIAGMIDYLDAPPGGEEDEKPKRRSSGRKRQLAAA